MININLGWICTDSSDLDSRRSTLICRQIKSYHESSLTHGTQKQQTQNLEK